MRGLLRPSFAEVDLSKIAANFRLLRGLVKPEAFVCPMVKADAYGHGDVEVGRALREEGAKHLGVALIEEGVALRDAGDRASLLVFTTFEDTASAQAMIDFDLTAVAGSWEQIEALKSVSSREGKKLSIHVEFNTGMNRLGFAPQDAAKLREFFDVSQALALEGVCTHLTHGEDAGISGGASARQIELFQKALEPFRGIKFAAHVLNSSGATALTHTKSLTKSDAPFGFRPGISLYGAQPCSQAEQALSLKPAMSIKSKIISLTHVPKGTGVSYDSTWTAKRDSVIGTIPFGYADGYSRRLSNRGAVLCNGKRVPVVGIVCMDYFMVDLTDLGAQVGVDVVLLGEQGAEIISVEEIAGICHTISYEVLTGISARVPRKYLPRGGANV